MNRQAKELQEVADFLANYGALTYAQRVGEAAEIVADIAKVLGSEPQHERIKLTRCSDSLPPYGLRVLAVLDAKCFGDSFNIAQFMYREEDGWYYSWNGKNADLTAIPKAWVSREDVFEAMCL